MAISDSAYPNIQASVEVAQKAIDEKSTDTLYDMFWPLVQKFVSQKKSQIQYIAEIRKKYSNQSRLNINDILGIHLDQTPFVSRSIFDKV